MSSTAWSLDWRGIALLAVALVAVYLAALMLRLFIMRRRRMAWRDTQVAQAAVAGGVPEDFLMQAPTTSTPVETVSPAFHRLLAARLQQDAADDNIDDAEHFEPYQPGVRTPVNPISNAMTSTSMVNAPMTSVSEFSVPAVPQPAISQTSMHQAAMPQPITPAEYDALRDEVAQLREQLREMQDELLTLKVTRNISPQYAEALGMAQRGQAASDIAQQCDISIGEAELVLALQQQHRGES